MSFTRKRKITGKNRNGILKAGILAAFILLSLFVVKPMIAGAEAKYLRATITADNGEIDFSPGIDDAVANFSYVRSGGFGAVSNIYDAKISIKNLPASGTTVKKLEIDLPIGMSWVDDASADKNLQTQMDASKGTNGIEKKAVDQTPVLGYNFASSGKRTYYMQPGTESIAVNIKVRMDTHVDIGYIEDAIKATLTVDDYSETAKVDVNAPTNASASGRHYNANFSYYVKAGTYYSGNESYNKLTYASYAGGVYDVQRLATQVRMYYHVNNPAAKIELNTTDTKYVLDDSGAAEGDYVLIYTPTTSTNVAYVAPWKIWVPADATEDVVVTGHSETDHWQLDGSTRTVPFSNQYKLTLKLAPESELVTVGLNGLNPANTATAFDYNTTTRVYVAPQDQETGVLGVSYINNRGSVDSAPKTVKMTFDTDVLGVMSVRLSCTPGSTITSAHIKTKSGIEKDVEINRTCNAYGWGGEFSYKDFGTERTDYIKEVIYDAGKIPAVTQLRKAMTEDASWSVAWFGARLTDERNGVATIEVYNTDDPTITTGVAHATTVFGAAASIDLSTMATQVVEAGKTLKFSVNITPYSSAMTYQHSILHPIIYIRQEVRDKDGNFLPISNLKVTNGSTRGNVDITEKFGQIHSYDTATAKVYVIDGRNISDASANISTGFVNENGAITYTFLNVSYTVETSSTTPDQTHLLREAVWAQSAGIDSMATHQYTNDPYELKNGVTGALVHNNGANYYQVRGSQSITVDNLAKHGNSSTWSKWSEGANPIAIGTSDVSSLNMNMQVVNNSGVEVPGPTMIYMPVPKVGENWGGLNYNGEDFEFSTALIGPLNNPDGNVFEIYYGRGITPSDDGSELESHASQFTNDTSSWTAADWKDVNCVKIVARNIPITDAANLNGYDFGYSVRVVDIDGISDGATDTWRPIYYQKLTNSDGDSFAGWYGASYISIRLADSKINGQLFVDANKNGKFDNNESALRESGWTIELYDRASNQLVQTTTTDADGKYEFIELLNADDGYYINVVNKHPITYGEDGGYLFTKKGAASNTDSYNSDNQAAGSKLTTPAHATGYIGSVSPARAVGEATYNIGVYDYVANAFYTAKVSFDDQNNASGNRPQTIKLTAKSEGAEDVIANLGAGDTALILPLYNTAGEALSYSFTAEDIAGYDKTISFENDVVAVKYTQRPAQIQTSATISAPTSVDSKDSEIEYEINYETTVSQYIGVLNTTIVSKLPYEIDETASELDGGVYDANAKTITWTVSEPSLNTYNETNGVKKIARSYSLRLAFIDVKARDALTNTLETETILSVKNAKTNDSATTYVLTPSKIKFRFVDENGNELADDTDVDGIVGDDYVGAPVSIPGYEYVPGTETKHTFAEDEQTVVYYYRKVVLPSTFDNVMVWVLILVASAAVLSGLKVWQVANRTK